MKKGIKTICYAILALACAAFSSCSPNEIFDDTTKSGEKIEISVIGQLDEYQSEEDTKASLVSNMRVGWSANDRVYVYDGSSYLGYVEAPATIEDDRVAVLSGSISKPAGSTLTFVYSNMLNGEPVVTDGAITVDMATQADKNAFVVYGKASVSQVNNLIVPFKFATSLVRISASNLASGASITEATLSGVNTACVLTLGADGDVSVSGDVPGAVTKTVSGWKASASGYAFVEIGVPASAPDANRKLTVIQDADGFNKYEKALLKTTTIKESKCLNSIATMDPARWICFTAVDPSVTIELQSYGEAPEVHLQYSTDGSSWEDDLAKGEKAYFRSTPGYTNSTFADILTYGNYHFSIEGGADISGDIMAIVSSDNIVSTLSSDYTFYSLFSSTDIVNAKDLVLSATVVSDGAYMEMFYYCERLESAPVIMATSVGMSSYMSMFSDCESLVSAPALPAKTLAPMCYEEMFSGCSSLVSAPELPATNLATYCYNSMFANCTSLIEAPELPAIMLANNCYCGMFSGCTSLAEVPTMSAMMMADGCCYCMFSGCTSLDTAPALPAEFLASGCYEGMFAECTNLETAPELPANTMKAGCYQDMFAGCTSLKTAPALPSEELAANCYNDMFNGCTSLVTAPELPAETLAEKCYYSMFYGCTSLETAPAISATTTASHCCDIMFRECTSLTTPPSTLPATSLAYACYCGMFYGCTSLETVPSLSATTMDESCCESMFNGCTKITDASSMSFSPEIARDDCCKAMFKGCTSLTTPPSSLSAPILESECYREMFCDCTSLTTSPVLPAETLVYYCYGEMFMNCTNLQTVTMLATSGLESSPSFPTNRWLENAGTSEGDHILYVSDELKNTIEGNLWYHYNFTTVKAYSELSN